MSKRWYVVHAYSGFEKSVQRALVERIQRHGMQDFFGRVLVPVEEVVELKQGQKSISERKFFPGYVLVEMEMNDESWHLVKSTPKVTGFVGGTANKPTPISEKEVEKIMQQMLDGVEKPRPKVLFEPGEIVRVKEGPFTDFHGSVEQVNYEKNRLRVSVTIFGRLNSNLVRLRKPESTSTEAHVFGSAPDWSDLGSHLLFGERHEMARYYPFKGV